MSQVSDIALLSQAWMNWNLDNMNQRFGQYVINTYFPLVRCSSIFYEQNDEKARQMLYSHFILGENIKDWMD